MNFYDFYEEGFQVFENILSKSEIEETKNKLDLIYKKQIIEFGEENLNKINEKNIVRCPILYDSYFLKFINSKFVAEIVKEILGDYAILSLQNSIIITPRDKHHQSFYHRDIIHQDFISSRPMGINIYYCLDEYNIENGGTCFIPKSHKMEKFPQNFEEKSPNIKSGSVILFDSMIYHKAGENNSDKFRYGINNMFTLPFIKQQIDLPTSLNGKYSEDSSLNRILGYHSKEYKSVLDFRNERMKKIK